MFDAAKLGDILIAAGLATPQDIQRALAHQTESGGRLGDNLVALGIVTEEQLDAVLNAKPKAPRSMKDTGIPSGQLMKHLARAIHTAGLETPSQMKDALKLPSAIINRLLEEAIDRKLVESLGAGGGGPVNEPRYALSNAGRAWAKELLEQCQYVGPAPVSLEAYHGRINRQRITNERIDQAMIEESFSDLIVPDEFIQSLGPGINSGRCLLLYGPPGNGKTSVATKVGAIFRNIVYIPHCVDIDGQIMKVFDPSIHQAVGTTEEGNGSRTRLVEEDFDQRWVPCRRPIVIAGGELTLAMLDLEYNDEAKFYEAPLHLKALGGTFIIDDFGRQFVSPSDLLNRWIVPLESRVDFMKLHTGKTFTIPFDELVIFSTNLSPKDLMDPAFLRRIPYKLKTSAPELADYRRIFENISAEQGLELDEDIFSFVIGELRKNKDFTLACYQPKFIADQVVAACKFMGEPPRYSRELVARALANLYVADDDEPQAEDPEAWTAAA